MSKIQVMDEVLANKIAAGEVVEKCVSIVKELVENSIDAGSKRIKVELIESGVKEIKVTDDGSGMDESDALLAFQRHATSKLLDEDDLFRINTLGFRGEALPSIASVSDVTLKTSTGDVGTEINIKGGKLISQFKSEARRGTIITVRNIFYNTPARLKHLSSLYAELANIVDYINKMALSHTDISFSLYNDGKLLLNTDGSNNQLKVINEIYGMDVTKKMIEVSCEDDDYEVTGYISYPEITKSNRNHIITFVNGRLVKNYELNKVINDSYHTYKPEDKYPIVVLNISVDSSLIDVNIHPTKQDIKFSKIEELKTLISNEIRSKLNSINFIPKVEIKEEKEVYVPQYKETTLNLERSTYVEKEPPKEIHFEIQEETHEYVKEGDKLPEMYPVGLVKGTYIICQNELGMYLIDQHAAKERVNYEYYLKVVGRSKDTISMLIPISIEIPKNEFIIIKQNMDILLDLGFEVEEFGINTLVFRSHPVWLPRGYEEEAIRKMLDLIVVKEQSFDKEKFNEKVAITMSCKLSIKANENISLNEMEILIDDLRKCKNPYTCPHGRPTVIFYSNYELEKLFKRAM